VESAAFLRQPPPPDDYSLYGKAVALSHDYYGRGYNEWDSAMSIEFELSYLTGNRSPQESVQAACTAINSILDKVNQERQAGT
jgi:hypothetical protein